MAYQVNFCETKEQLKHLAEVVTGKAEGSPTGADINTSTLAYAGLVRDTLPELLSKLGWYSAGEWSTDPLISNDNQYVLYNGIRYVPLSTPYQVESTANPDPELLVGTELKVITDVTDEDITEAQNDIIGGSIFKGPNGKYVKNGDTVPSKTPPITHLRALVGGEPKIVAMSPIASGVVADLTDASATIGGVTVTFRDINYEPLASEFKLIAWDRSYVNTSGFSLIGIGSDKYYRDSSLDDVAKDPEFNLSGDKFSIFDSNGKAYTRVFNKNCHPEQFGFVENLSVDYIDLLESIRDYAVANGGGDMRPEIENSIFSINRQFKLNGLVDITGNFGIHHQAISVSNPDNRFLLVQGEIDTIYGTLGVLTAGQTTFSFPNSGDFELGELVQIRGGQDPNDPVVEKVRYFARVLNNTGGQLTLSVPCPENFGAQTTPSGNRVIKFTRPNENTKIGNITLTRGDTQSLIDLGVVFQDAINPIVGSISAPGETDFTVYEHRRCSSPKCGKITRGNGTDSFSSSGRLFNGWGSTQAYIESVEGSTETSLGFSESKNDLTVGRIFGKSSNLNLNCVSASGDAKIDIREYIFASSNSIPALAENQEGSTVRVERLTLCNAQKNCILRGVKFLNLAYLNQVFDSVNEVFIKIDLPASSTVTIPIGNGISTNLEILAFRQSNLGTLTFGNAGSQVNILDIVTGSNEWFRIERFSRFGSDYPYNTDGNKEIVIENTTANTDNYILLKCRLIAKR